MTATEQLKHQLDALPPKVREAEAERILDELKKRLQKHQIEAADSEAPEKPVTFDHIKHLAGIAKKGPRDLATNPKYLDDLGESSMR